MATVLVIGATGNVGRHVVRELLDRDVAVRAFVRNPPAAAALLGSRVPLAAGDLADRESIARALDGCDRVFLTSSDGPAKVEQETAAIDAVASAGARPVVKLSTIGAEVGGATPSFDWHGRIERHLRGSGVPAVVLQSNFYMSNVLGSAGAIAATGTLFAPAAGAKVSMIDPRDVAAAAAALLAADGHETETIVATGPEPITFDDVASGLSEALGRTIAFVDVPDDAARASMLEAGMPAFMADLVVAVFAFLRTGAAAVTTDAVRVLTGREPRRFAEFARDHAALFSG